jgi:hypothetical protein
MDCMIVVLRIVYFMKPVGGGRMTALTLVQIDMKGATPELVQPEIPDTDGGDSHSRRGDSRPRGGDSDSFDTGSKR